MNHPQLSAVLATPSIHRMPVPPRLTLGSARLEADYAFIADAARRRVAPLAFKLDGVPPPPLLRRVQPSRQAEHICFHDFPSSPLCIKVRAMLRYKGLAFEAVDPLGPRQLLAPRRVGCIEAPALQIDSRWILDSTEIARELDRLFPAQPLIPVAPRALALSHAIEQWADGAMHFNALGFLWLDERNCDAQLGAFGRGLVGRLSHAWCRARVRRQLLARGLGRQRPADVEADLQRHLAQADALLADAPFLLGDRPWLCDFALFGQIAGLMLGEAGRDMVRQHAQLAIFVNRMRALGPA